MAALRPADRPWLRWLDALVCPICHSPLQGSAEFIGCPGCRNKFPLVGQVPVLLNEANSLFTVQDVEDSRSAAAQPESGLRHRVNALLPNLGTSIKSRRNYDRLADEVLSESRRRVLVIGGRIVGTGMNGLLDDRIELIETDVVLGDRTTLICDAHDLPFADGSIDAVVCQAVLEHVLDPYRCVAEIERVLRPGGLVYAETPFMQQVHGGRYDFTRFSPLGHRWLFRNFEEISVGSSGGPAIVLAWSYSYFLQGFATTRRGRQLAVVLARVTGFWLKYLDRVLIDRRGAQDGTWGYFFLGRKGGTPLTTKELLLAYPGIT